MSALPRESRHSAQVHSVLAVQEYFEDRPTPGEDQYASLLEMADQYALGSADVIKYQPSLIANIGMTASGRIVDLHGSIAPAERVTHTHLFALGTTGLGKYREFVISHRHVAAPVQPFEPATIRQTTLSGMHRNHREITATTISTWGRTKEAPLLEIDYEDMFMALLCSQTVRQTAQSIRDVRTRAEAQLEVTTFKKAVDGLKSRIENAYLPDASWAKQ